MINQHDPPATMESQVITVPLICDGFIQLTAETLEAIPDVWTAQCLGSPMA